MTDIRPPRDPRRQMDLDDEEAETEHRDYADWVKDIGPEGIKPEQVEEYLQEYGWDQMDDDAYVSNPVTPADMPDWANVEQDMVYDNEDSPLEVELERAIIDQQSERPVEDAAFDEIEGDELQEGETI